MQFLEKVKGLPQNFAYSSVKSLYEGAVMLEDSYYKPEDKKLATFKFTTETPRGDQGVLDPQEFQVAGPSVESVSVAKDGELPDRGYGTRGAIRGESQFPIGDSFRYDQSCGPPQDPDAGAAPNVAFRDHTKEVTPREPAQAVSAPRPPAPTGPMPVGPPVRQGAPKAPPSYVPPPPPIVSPAVYCSDAMAAKEA